MPNTPLDAIDHSILAALQANGRLTNVELAEQVGLSASPCLRRVRLLEKAGVLSGYHARLDRAGVGLGLTVFVGVKVSEHDDKRAASFRAAIAKVPEIISCHLVSGDTDFLLEVVVQDLPAYERLLMTVLLKLPGVKDIRSNFAIQTMKAAAPLPLGHLKTT